MKNTSTPLCLAAIISFLAGCGSESGGKIGWGPIQSPADVTVNSQTFTSGYISNINSGEADMVLVYDPVETMDRKTGPGPIQPLPSAPMRQWLHIHINWRPESKMGAGHPASVNASLDWYILNGDDFKTGEWLYYGGAGYVLVSDGGRIKAIDIVDAEMVPRNRQGNMSDPIGSVRVHGRLGAVQNEAKLEDLMMDLKKVPKSPAIPVTGPTTAPAP